MNLKPGVMLKTPFQFFYSPYNEGCVKFFIPSFRMVNTPFELACSAYQKVAKARELLREASIWKGADVDTGLCDGYVLRTKDLPSIIAQLTELGYIESEVLKHFPWVVGERFHAETEEQCPWINYTSDGSMCLACGNKYSNESLLLGCCDLCDTPFEDDPYEPLEQFPQGKK
jgi:hypothetical protein